MAKIANAVEEAAEYAVENVVEAVETVENMRFLNKYTLIGFGAAFAVGVVGTVVVWKARKAKAAAALEAASE